MYGKSKGVKRRVQIPTEMKVFQRGCCMVSLETNLKRLNMTKVQEENYWGHPCQNTALSHANCSNFFSSCSNPNMTTNTLQAEIPMELMMAEASDTPQVGIDTFYFQTLTNRISCGSPCHLEMFAFHHKFIVLKDFYYRPLAHLNRVNPNSSIQMVVGKANWMWQGQRVCCKGFANQKQDIRSSSSFRKPFQIVSDQVQWLPNSVVTYVRYFTLLCFSTNIGTDTGPLYTE